MDNLPRSHHGMKTKESSATEKKVTPDKQAQEWTTEYLDSFWKDCDSFEALERACKAINASIAAEREKTKKATERYCRAVEGEADAQLEIQRLRTQLAAAQAAIKELADLYKKMQQLKHTTVWGGSFEREFGAATEAKSVGAKIVEKLEALLKINTTALDSAISDKVKDFAAKILHGDDVHKAWLMEAADSYVNGFSIPASRSSPITDDEVNEAWSELEAELDIGYITDGKTWECGECGAQSKDKNAIKHNEGCIHPAWDKVSNLNRKAFASKNASIAEATKPYVEALQCAEYAISHPESDQAFALNAVRDAIGQADALLAKEKQP